jgi:hypothetical protein
MNWTLFFVVLAIAIATTLLVRYYNKLPSMPAWDWMRGLKLTGKIIVGLPVILLAVWLWLLAMGLVWSLWSTTFAHETPPPPSEEEVAERVAFDRHQLHSDIFTRGAQQNGWQAMPSTAIIPYDMRSLDIGKGPTVYTGLSVALMEGGKVIAEFPQHHDTGWWRLLVGGEKSWKSFGKHTTFTFPVSAWTALYLQGDVKQPVTRPFMATLQTVEPDDPNRLRIPTFQILEGGAHPWGPLLDSDEFRWRLYIRFSRSDGIEPEKSFLQTHPAVVGIQFPADTYSTHVSQSEFEISSTAFEGKGAGSLQIGAPSTMRVEVILLVLPREA